MERLTSEQCYVALSFLTSANDPSTAPTLLMIEQLPAIVKEQVKAIQNLQIDKITVWDSGHNGSGGNGATADFLSGLIGALPAVHELAEQAGIDLPPALGRLHDHGLARAVEAAGNGAPEIEEDSAAVVPPPVHDDQETV